MIVPHGGNLQNRILHGEERTEWLAKAPKLPTVPVTPFTLSELDNIACGLYSPLTGFMDATSYDRVIKTMRLPEGAVWPIPIVLPVDVAPAKKLSRGKWAALQAINGVCHGVMKIADVFERDPKKEAQAVYGTTEENHPGVARLYNEPRTLIGGEICLLVRAPVETAAQYRFDPVQTRRLFQEKGWKTIVAFQTRNPIHRAHEYLQKCALEMVDGLFINPLIGETKQGDIPASVRMKCYQVLIENYFPKDRVLLGTFPAPMRYAGPREAIFHAICRKNYGCTHIIIGRDHAGVGNYYDTYAAQEIFDRFDSNELGIVPLKFEHAFYCRRCAQMATRKTCPHDVKDHLFLSGTKVREMLQEGQDLPPEFSRQEVAQILKAAQM